MAGKNVPNFEMLDARIASALNKIIQNSHFKKKVSLEEQKAIPDRTSQFFVNLLLVRMIV